MRARCNHFVKMVSAQKDSRFYVSLKTIHNQAKYIVMDCHDQEAK